MEAEPRDVVEGVNECVAREREWNEKRGGKSERAERNGVER